MATAAEDSGAGAGRMLNDRENTQMTGDLNQGFNGSPSSYSPGNTGTNTEDSSGSNKRRKTHTACVYCRRSHMTCNKERPCSRCIKRGIGHLCDDDPQSKIVKSNATIETNATTPLSPVNEDPSTHNFHTSHLFTSSKNSMENVGPIESLAKPAVPVAKTNEIPSFDIYSSTNVQPSSATLNQLPFFYSEHAGSEFHSLTEFLSMIDDNDMINSINLNNDPLIKNLEASTLTRLTSQQPSQTDIQINDQYNKNDANLLANEQKNQQISQIQQHQQQDQKIPQQQKYSFDYNPQNQQKLSYISPYNNVSQSQLPPAAAASNVNSSANGAQPSNNPYVSDAARDKFFLTAADPTIEISPEERLKQVINAKLEAGLLKPYDYAKGYQRLQNYMNTHMAPSSRERILKPLSTFRPGFRAIAKTLKDIDLILVEENFERMLLDYDRVFTSMAIPACLWRRTGEIYRGNKEFASLVDVNIEDLKNGKLTIYELMTEESSVNFWEKYGAIAFDKTQKAVLSSCKLRTKDGRRKKNCCFSFTIRRDRYNIPSCIVGNFIPIQ